MLNITSSPGFVVGLPQRCHLEHIGVLGIEVPPEFVAASYRCCYFSTFSTKIPIVLFSII